MAPARTSRRWLAVSASAGASRRVRPKRRERRMLRPILLGHTLGDRRRTGDVWPRKRGEAGNVKTGVTMEKLVSLCKRRGFVFPSSEIYGGFNGVWDYGPLGVELRNNVKQAWWRDYVWARPDVVGLDPGSWPPRACGRPRGI